MRPRIVFGTNRQGTNHAFRHVEALGLRRDTVMQAIADDLLPRLPLPRPLNNVPYQGAVTVASIRLRYHAFALEGGFVNVGRITPA